MHKEILALWERCRTFVSAVCKDRDSSHGLSHMSRVTELALLLYFMDHGDSSGEGLSQDDNLSLIRIILVGMLHDVADYKYEDTEGSLQKRVDLFVHQECERLQQLAQKELAEKLFAPAQLAALRNHFSVEEESRKLRLVICSISFSKEKKQGMNWYADSSLGLDQDWISVRNWVSDADKLEAIGESGLLRCYHYGTVKTKGEGVEWPHEKPLPPTGTAEYKRLESYLLNELTTHHEEKLVRLVDEYIRTPAGKMLGQIRQKEMNDLLEKWKASEPPPFSYYWN